MGFEKEVMQQYIIANDKAARAQRSSAKQPPIKHPVVLENILDRNKVAYKIELGVLEIPTNQIVGIAAADQRELLYASNFMPLSKANTEFANTWRHLYQEFLSDDGLCKPIRCYEYLGKFYVQDTPIAFAANQRDEVRNLHEVAGALGAQPGMKQQTFIAAGNPDVLCLNDQGGQFMSCSET